MDEKGEGEEGEGGLIIKSMCQYITWLRLLSLKTIVVIDEVRMHGMSIQENRQVCRRKNEEEKSAKGKSTEERSAEVSSTEK